MIVSQVIVPVPEALSPGGTPGPQAGRPEVMTATPGWVATKDAPVTPSASISSPLACGARMAGLAWMGAHLRAAVPFRSTVTAVPRATQNDLPPSAAVMVSLPCPAGWPPGHCGAAPTPDCVATGGATVTGCC